LTTGRPLFDDAQFATALSNVEGALSAARAASSEANQYAVLAYFRQERGRLFDAIIVQYNPERPEHPHVMLIDTQTRATLTLRKRLPVGTIIKVLVDHANPDDGTLIVKFVSEA
jgi:predicted LPLAT superfamily acyltransferase